MKVKQSILVLIGVGGGKLSQSHFTPSLASYPGRKRVRHAATLRQRDRGLRERQRPVALLRLLPDRLEDGVQHLHDVVRWKQARPARGVFRQGRHRSVSIMRKI